MENTPSMTGIEIHNLNEIAKTFHPKNINTNLLNQ